MAKKNKKSSAESVVGTLRIGILTPKEIIGTVLDYMNGSLILKVKRKRSKLYTNRIIDTQRIAGIFTVDDSPTTYAELVGQEVTIITVPELEILPSPVRTGVGNITVNDEGMTVCNSPDGTFMVNSRLVEVDADEGAEVGEKRGKGGRKKNTEASDKKPGRKKGEADGKKGGKKGKKDNG